MGIRVHEYCMRPVALLALLFIIGDSDAFASPNRGSSSLAACRSRPRSQEASYARYHISCHQQSSCSNNNAANASSKNDEEDNRSKTDNASNSLSRTEFIQSLGVISTSLGINPSPASAGLIQFPCNKPLANTYHLMRAGQSLLEAEDIWATNPLFLTNRECALSDLGIRQVEEACRYLNDPSTGVSAPTIVRHSFAANAIDTANIVGRDLRLGRDRLVPEFFFLDPRAVGLWDNLPISQAESAVWAMDADEAGQYGTNPSSRPPPNEDGTPAETLSDQVPRLRQLLSACESIYSGDTVLLIFPDGTGPALLSCLIGGIPLSRTHELELKSGEVRTNVNYESVKAMMGDQPSEEYRAAIGQGREKLKALRAQKDKVVNVKDQRYAQELREEEARVAEAERKKAEKEEAERLRREEMSKRVERERKEKKERDDDVDTTPIVAALVGAGALGVGASFMSQDEIEDEVTEVEGVATNGAVNTTTTAPATAFANSTATVDSAKEILSIRSINGVPISDATSFMVDVSKEDKSKDASADAGVAATSQSAPSSPAGADSLHDDDLIASTPQDRLERAEKAMQDYMEQDDGGEAWLSMLSDIIVDGADDDKDEA